MGLQFSNHTVESTLPHLFKPFSMTKPFYESGTNHIVCFNKRSAISISKIKFLRPPYGGIRISVLTHSDCAFGAEWTI